MSALNRTTTGARRLERLFDWLASPSGILVAALILVLATAVALGLAALGQLPASGPVGRVAEILEIGDPFRSWWYGAVLILAGSAALAAFIEGVRLLRAPGRAPVRLRATLSGTCDPRLIAALLRQRVGRVTAGPAGGFRGERGRARRAAPVVGSLGGLVLCGGILWAAHGGESGWILLEEGATAYGYQRRTAAQPVRVDLGAELQVERRAPTGGQAPRWRLVLARGPDVFAQADVALGGGLEYQGRQYRLEAVRPGRLPGRFQLRVEGGPERSLAVGEPVDAGDGVRIAILAYDPDYRGRHGPAVKVGWSRGGAEPEVGWVLARFPDFDGRVRRSKPSVVFAGYEARPDLVIGVERSAGVWLIVAGALVLLLGLGLFFGPPPARIEARQEEERWILTGEAAPDAQDFARIFDEIAALLCTSLGPEAGGRRSP
jgi:hypothetical protein